MSSAITDAQIQALEQQLVNGVQSVEYRDRKVTNYNANDLIRSLNYLQRCQDAATAEASSKKRRAYSLARIC